MGEGLKRVAKRHRGVYYVRAARKEAPYDGEGPVQCEHTFSSDTVRHTPTFEFRWMHHCKLCGFIWFE